MASPDAVAYQKVAVGSRAVFDLPVSANAASRVRGEGAIVGESPTPLPLPPLFRQKPDWIQPLEQVATGTRSFQDADAFILPALIEKTVSRDRPIGVELMLSQTEFGDAFAVFPVVFDDEFYYLAGPPVRPDQQPPETRRGDKLALQVTRLPNLNGEPPLPAEAARTRIGVLRALKLGFFKLVGIPSADVGLRVPRIDGAKVMYEPVQQGQLQQGRVALLAHGFLSETGWMVQGLMQELRAAGYDHVVTWDYETYTTPVREICDGLATKLLEAGVAAGSERVDVVAHSMGTLVTRSLIARIASPRLVKRALLLGAPNAGTPLAKAPDQITSLASMLINVEVGPVSLRKIVRFLWEAVDNGLDDLQPDSDLLRWINGPIGAQTSALTIAAGTSSAGGLGTLFQRTLYQAAELYYGGPNDLVVAVESMRSVASPPYFGVQIEEVACNHFDYLVPTSPARAVVNKWVSQK